MHLLLQYQKQDGTIDSLWQASPPTLLVSQVVDTDPLRGYVVVDTDLPAEQLLTEYYLREGTLTRKTTVTITAQPSPFAADGTTVCHLTVEPFRACTLVVGGTPQVLTQDDPVLALTADHPTTFLVTLAPMAGYRADRLLVEAL